MDTDSHNRLTELQRRRHVLGNLNKFIPKVALFLHECARIWPVDSSNKRGRAVNVHSSMDGPGILELSTL